MADLHSANTVLEKGLIQRQKKNPNSSSGLFELLLTNHNLPWMALNPGWQQFGDGVFSKWLSPCKRREKGPWRNSFLEFGVAELDVPAWSPNLDPIWHHLDELEHQLQVWPRHNPASLMSLEASAWFQYFADCHRGVEAAAAAKRAPTPY